MEEYEWFPLPEVEDNVWDDTMPHAPSDLHTPTDSMELSSSQTQGHYSDSGITPVSLNAAFSPLVLEETLTPHDCPTRPLGARNVSSHDLTITSIPSTSSQSGTPWAVKHCGTIMNSVSSEKSLSTHLDPTSSSATTVSSVPGYPTKQPSQLYTSRHVSPSELDQLWKKFLATSIGDPKTPSNTNHSNPHCTCHNITDQYGVSKSNPVHCYHLHSNTQSAYPTPPVARTDMSIQTTSSLLQLQASQPRRTSSDTSPPQAPDSTLTPLTLQEALEVFHPQFIVESKKRERRVRERRREDKRPNPIGSGAESERKTPKFIHMGVRRNRLRMSTREMYEQSMRYWEKLPEVQEKMVGQKRRAQAATNRLRVRLYQKEVLARMRLRRKKAM